VSFNIGYFNVHFSWFNGSNTLQLTPQPGTIAIASTSATVALKDIAADFYPADLSASVKLINISAPLSVQDFADTLVLTNIIPEA